MAAQAVRGRARLHDRGTRQTRAREARAGAPGRGQPPRRGSRGAPRVGGPRGSRPPRCQTCLVSGVPFKQSARPFGRADWSQSAPISRVLWTTAICLADRIAPAHPASCAWLCGAGSTSPDSTCSRWGLPCRFPRGSRGGLLPHRFTLTAGLAAGGGLFSVVLSLSPCDGRRSHLATTLPCGARTFLGHRDPVARGGDARGRPARQAHAMRARGPAKRGCSAG